MSDKLTIKQDNYCQYYVSFGDKTKAYKKAYNCIRMKPQTITRNANALIKIDKIATRIQQLQKEMFERNKATIDEVISIMSDNLRFDPVEMINDDGSIKKIKDMPKNIRMVLAGIDVDEIIVKGKVIGETKKIRFNSRTQIIDMFMKHLGGYEKDNKQQQDNITIFKIPDNGR